MKRIAILTTLVVCAGLLVAPAHAVLDGPACTDTVCDYWRSEANAAEGRTEQANQRVEAAEAQLLTHAGEFASLRFQVTTLRDDLADERRATARAWRAEQRQRRVAERYFLRVLKMQEQVILLRIKLGLPVRRNR